MLVINTDPEQHGDTSYICDVLREQSQILQACRCATFEVIKFS